MLRCRRTSWRTSTDDERAGAPRYPSVALGARGSRPVVAQGAPHHSRRGRVCVRPDPQEVLAALEPAGFLCLPIAGEHAARVASLPSIHRDPFDRMLIAQALVEPMRLLTDDAILDAYGEIVTVV